MPNEYVKIELTGGSVFTVKYAEILKFTKEKQVKPEQQQSTGQLNTQQMMEYERDKKSSGTAVLLSLVLTSAGHAYAGNWPRGLIFTAARVGGVVLALTAGYESKSYSSGYYYYSYDYYLEEITAWFYIGLGVTLVAAIWEAIDAGAEANRYNEDLYNKMKSGMPLGFDIVPIKDGAKLQLKYHF